MRRPVATDPETRRNAVARAREVGAAEASRELGIPAATIRGWRHRSGESGPPSGTDPSNWAERKERGARDTWEAAAAALERVKKLLKAGDERKAKDAALTAAILIDKSSLLEAGAAAAADRRVHLDAEQGRQIAAVLEMACQAIGVPLSPQMRQVFGELCRRAGAGEPLAVDPAAAQVVHAEVRQAFESEVRAALEPVLRRHLEPRWGDLRPALMPPSDDATEELHEPMAAPRTIVRTLSEPRPEPVDAEIVPEAEPRPMPGRGRPRIVQPSRHGSGSRGRPDPFGMPGL